MHHTLRRVLISALLIASMILNVRGQSVSLDTTEFLFNTLEEITLSSSSASKATPLSISKLKVDDQLFSAVERLDQFLNFVPGLEMQSGALNTNRIHIRGIGSRSPFATSKIKAYLDDIPLTDGIGETSMEDLNLSFLDVVEVWKGPFSSTYGAPLGGIIRFKTPSINSQNAFISENTVGDFGFLRTENSLQLKTSERSTLFISDEILTSEGYRSNNEVDKHNLNILWKGIQSRTTFTFLASYIDLYAQIPSSLNSDDFNNNPSVAAGNWQSVNGYEDYSKLRLGFNMSHTFSDQSSLSNTLYGYFFNSFELRPFNVLDDENSAFSIRTRYLKPFGKFNIEVGQETFLDDYKYDIYETDNGNQGALIEQFQNKRRSVNLFSEVFVDLSESIKMGGGLNYQTISYNLENIGTQIESESSYPSILSPRLYISYLISRSLDFRVDIAHGSSNPSLDESLNPDGTFNQEIGSERGWSYEATLSYNPSNKFNVRATTFWLNAEDIIVNRQTPQGQVFGVNGGSTTHRGMEIQAQFNESLTDNLSWNTLFNGSFGSYRFDDFIDGSDDFSGNQLTGVAPNKWSIQSKLSWGHCDFVVLHRFVDEIPIDDANITFNEAFHVTNFLFRQNINIGNWTLGMVAEVENIFDNDYASMVAVNASSFGGNAPRYYYPGLPINGKYTMSLSYRW